MRRRSLRVLAVASLVSLSSVAACNGILGIDPPNVVYDDEDASDPTRDAAVRDDGGARPDAPPSSYPPCGEGQVRVVADVGAFCIDTVEVSVSAYARFLEAGAPSAKLRSCVWKTGAQPDQWNGQVAKPQGAVVNVDWCDAFDYCAWQKKRLCGQIGEPDAAAGWLTTVHLRDSQWYTACSGDGTHAYPYGDSYVAGACNVKGPPDASIEPVSTRPRCVTGDGGAKNLVGNAIEWIDACDKNTMDASASRDHCDLRGGSYRSSESVLDCSFVVPAERRMRADDIGFRCCSD